MASNSASEFLDAPDAATLGFTGPPQDQTNAPATLPGPVPLAPASVQTNAPAAATTNAPAAIPQPQYGPQFEFQKAMEQQKQDYLKKAQQPGVPLDIESGISPWEKFMLSFRREHENQVKYLQKQYGEENVRLDPYGKLIVRAMDPDTQKAKDILVDPDKMSAKDLISIAGSVPEIAAGIIAVRGGRAAPVLSKLKGALGLQRDVLATALGAETAGAAKDIAVGAIDQPSGPDVPKILKERGAMAATDVGVGEATMGAGRIFNWARQGPLRGSAGPVQFDNFAAKEYVKQKYGIDVPQTIGEMTGSPLFSRSETFFEKLPGGSEPFKALRGQQEEALRRLQMIMMGKTPPTDEAAGRQIIDELMTKIAPAQTAVTAGERALASEGTKGIENLISGLTIPESQVLREETGKAVRAGVIARRDATKAEADRLYGIVRSLPGGEGKVFPGRDLQASFKDILSKLPGPETITRVPTGIVGPTGTPIMRDVAGREVLKEFVPPNVLARLQGIVGLKNPQFSLSDLQQMRREVYDDIAKGEGVPGLGTHYLSDIGKALTDAIESGVDKLPTGDLKTALQTANTFYKDKVRPFSRIGLTEMFRNPDEAGGLSDYEVISRVFGGGKAVKNYGLLKEVLGDTSPEFTRVKRAIADNILERSRYPGDELIDPKSFTRNLSDFARDYGEISNDVFGRKINDLFRQAKFMSVGELSSSEKVNAKDFASLIADPNPTAAKLRGLVTAERNRDRLYKNEILRLIAKKELPDAGINPVDFVNRFVDMGTPGQISQVMDLIKGNPNLVNDVKAKVVEKVFRDAARPATPGDIGKLLSGDPTRIVSATSVFKQIEDPSIREKIKTIVGPDVYNDLVQYLKIHAAGEAKETSYKAAGGLAAGQQITRLERHVGSFLKATGMNWLVSNFLTNDAMRSWLGQVGPRASENPAFWNTLFTSPVFLQVVARDFPGMKGSLFINSLKAGMDRWVKQAGGQPPEGEAPGDSNVIKKNLNDYLESPQ